MQHKTIQVIELRIFCSTTKKQYKRKWQIQGRELRINCFPSKIKDEIEGQELGKLCIFCLGKLSEANFRLT